MRSVSGSATVSWPRCGAPACGSHSLRPCLGPSWSCSSSAPRGRALTGAVLYGLLNFGAGLALAYYALVQLHAGFVQMLLALVPLVTLLLAVAQRQERLHLAAVAGTLLAVAGVAVLSRAPLRESLPLLSVLATLGSAVCIAQAAVLVRRFPRCTRSP